MSLLTLPDSKPVIHTARLELRQIRKEDAVMMFDVLNDPLLYTFTSDAPPPSIGALAEIYERRELGKSPDGNEIWLNWLLFEKNLKRPIGYVQASVTISHADLAWVVGTRWQSRGYATEAATAMIDWLKRIGVGQFRACIHPDHMASQTVAKNIGLYRTENIEKGEEVWILSMGKA
jgi:RimJ/RimL family protein N-acetyltransferase